MGSPPRSAAKSPRVGIVGAGMSGLCMAAKLRGWGSESFVVFEKAGDVGGTWRENTYPGLSCDVPSRFYSYSFAANPGWSHLFPPGPEVQRYFRSVADDLDLRRHIRFGSEVTDARWADGRWTVKLSDGSAEVFDVLVMATGVLHQPRLPEIDGASSFDGTAFHTARWDHSVRLDGGRIGVIGTGSTGAQLVTALAGRADKLAVFQRTAQWVIPLPNPRYARHTRWLYRRFPKLNALALSGYQHTMEAVLGTAPIKDGWARKAVTQLAQWNLRLAVRDPDLRRRLTPDFEVMCKRLIMSAGFYPAMRKPGVELVVAGIERIEPGGIRTADGTLHELDVIVYATGFDAHAFMRPMRIRGEDGVTLEEAWAEGPHAYRTVALPSFPNLFMMLGPHSPIGNQSLVPLSETAAEYVLRWLELIRDGRVQSASVAGAATAAFNAEMKRDLPGTVWATGCQSWYLDQDGLPELWPWSPARHRELLAEPDLADFVLRSGPSG